MLSTSTYTKVTDITKFFATDTTQNVLNNYDVSS